MVSAPPVYDLNAMSDLSQQDRVLTDILEESWEIFRKDLLVYLIAAVICAILIGLSLGILSGTMAVGLCLLVRRLRNGEEAGATSVLDGFSHFLSSTLATLVILIGVTVGLALLVLPGLFLMAAWSMTFHAMAFENLGVGAALARSYDIFKQNSLLVVLLLIVLGLLNTLSSVLVLTGLLTVPYSAIALSVAYDKLAQKSAEDTKVDALKPFSVK